MRGWTDHLYIQTFIEHFQECFKFSFKIIKEVASHYEVLSPHILTARFKVWAESISSEVSSRRGLK